MTGCRIASSWYFSLLLVALPMLFARVAHAKTAYLDDCNGYDDQRWNFHSGPFDHNTLIRLSAFPDWCLVHYDVNSTQPSNFSSVYVDICDVPSPASSDFLARIWTMANSTIQLPGSAHCLAINGTGHNASLVLMDCDKLLSPQADFTNYLNWFWNNSGLIINNASSPVQCITVNMSSPTPPHPTPPGPLPGDFNVVAVKCDPSDRLQQWSGLPGANGTIHHMANTSYCLAGHGDYPGVHGPNVVISPCNLTDPTQIYMFDNKTAHICTKAQLVCNSATPSTKGQCCMNVAHTTDTPQPGNDIELYNSMADQTEQWEFNPNTRQLQSCGLCMSIVK